MGIAADLLELIFGRLGLSYKLVVVRDWEESLARSRAGQVHILPFLNKTPQRAEWLFFTDPIFVDPNVLITKNDHPFISNPHSLKGSTIVLPSGTAMEEFMRRDYPNFEIRTVDSEEEAFSAVAKGEADMTMRSLVMAISTIRRDNYHNLKIAGQIPEYTNYLRMGVHKNEPLVRDILERAIASLSPQDQAEIVHRYVGVTSGTTGAWGESLEWFVVFMSSSAWYWSYRLQMMNEERKILLDNIDSHVWYLRDSHTYGAVNQAHAQFFGLAPADLAYKKIPDVLGAEVAKDFIANSQQAFAGKRQVRTEQTLIDGQGRKRILAITQTPVADRHGGVDYVVCSATDITDQKRAMAEIEYLSFRDVLTGLYNRRFYEAELQRLDVPHNLPFSLVMIDVNGLKLTNDAFGHAVGDSLIQKVAEVLKEVCRADDIVARIGGDEFAILLPGTSKEQAQLYTKKVLQAMASRTVQGLPISVACGWATKTNHATNIDAVFKEAEDFMYREKVSERSSYRYQAVQLIMRTLYAKSPREQQHAEAVSALCSAMGAAMGHEVHELTTAGMLHDIGKVAINESILEKHGPPTETEWGQIEKHPEAGYNILKSAAEYGLLAEYVLAHHERWDGTGYPNGLQGEAIPLPARIIAIADAYDTMVNHRPYNSAVTPAEAVEKIRAGAGSQFDPEIVKVFVELMEHRGVSKSRDKP